MSPVLDVSSANCEMELTRSGARLSGVHCCGIGLEGFVILD